MAFILRGMNNFIYQAPTKMIFGRDTHTQVGSIIREYGFKKVLIHYGQGSVIKSGLLDAVRGSLKEAGVVWMELGGVKPNPELSLVRKGVALCKHEKVDCILAVGGGSPIDSAKLIAHGALVEDDPWVFSAGEKISKGALPIGVILTLAAAGSEMSASCVITNEDGWLKRGFTSEFNRPLFAILDPPLTYSVSPYQTACGIVDIIMHTLERYLSPGKDSTVSDRLAEGLMKAVIDAGPIAMQQPNDYEARATLMWASSVSHNGLTGLGRAVFMPVHQMEHELSGAYTEVAHAAGLSALLSAWMRYAYPHDVQRFAQFATRVMGCDMDFEHPERSAELGIQKLETFFRSLGMPVNLVELGIPDTSRFDEMAEKCTFFGKRTLDGTLVMGKREILDVFHLAFPAKT